MKEWSRKNEFNSFNSWKGLLYSRHYEAIIDWKDGKVRMIDQTKLPCELVYLEYDNPT